MTERVAAIGELEVLDAGRSRQPSQELAALLGRCARAEAACCGRDRNAVCYEARLAAAEGEPTRVVVKVPRLWARRSNPDATFEGEARNLTALAARGLGSLPELHGRYRLQGRHFLVISHVPGRHPEPFGNPLTPAQMDALLAWSLAAECVGFMHYDLKPANLLTDGGSIGILDLEFGRFESNLDPEARPSGPAAGAPLMADARWCDDCNVAMNAHWPRRSNTANLEFRTLDRHCRQLERRGRAGAVRDLVTAWLHAKSRYHQAVSGYLVSHARRPTHDPPEQRAAAGRLPRAIAHEQELAAVYERSDEALITVERALMNARARVFDPDRNDAARALIDARAAIAAAGSSLPAAYLADASWVVDRLESKLAHDTASRRAARPGEVLAGVQYRRSSP